MTADKPRDLGEPLTRDEIIAALTGLDIGPTESTPLTAQQARRVASVMWNRIQVHRNRAYELGYAHGYRNHNSVCERATPVRQETTDLPLFEVGD